MHGDITNGHNRLLIGAFGLITAVGTPSGLSVIDPLSVNMALRSTCVHTMCMGCRGKLGFVQSMVLNVRLACTLNKTGIHLEYTKCKVGDTKPEYHFCQERYHGFSKQHTFRTSCSLISTHLFESVNSPRKRH